MASIPVWLVGSNPTHTLSCVLTVQTVSTAGVLADGTAYTLTGDLQEISFAQNNEVRNIRALTSPWANNVKVFGDFTLTLVELVKATGTNKLGVACYSSTGVGVVVKVVFARGAQSYTMYGVVESCEESAGDPPITTRAVIRMVDISAANAAYA